MKKLRLTILFVSSFLWLVILSAVIYTIIYYSHRPIMGISFPVDTTFLDVYFYLSISGVLFSNMLMYFGKIDHLNAFRKSLFIATTLLPIITISFAWLIKLGEGWYWTYIDYFGIFTSGVINYSQQVILLFVVGGLLLSVANVYLFSKNKRQMDNKLE